MIDPDLSLGAQSGAGLFFGRLSISLRNCDTPRCGFTKCERKQYGQQKGDARAVLAFDGTLGRAKNDEQDH
jgi:hypothetical protein